MVGFGIALMGLFSDEHVEYTNMKETFYTLFSTGLGLHLSHSTLLSFLREFGVRRPARPLQRYRQVIVGVLHDFRCGAAPELIDCTNGGIESSLSLPEVSCLHSLLSRTPIPVSTTVPSKSGLSHWSPSWLLCLSYPILRRRMQTTSCL